MNRATLLAALGAAALPVPARAQTAALAVGAGLIEPQAQAYYARANGFFKSHGLDVNVVTSANGAATTAAVAGGSLQIGITSVLGRKVKTNPLFTVFPTAADARSALIVPFRQG